MFCGCCCCYYCLLPKRKKRKKGLGPPPEAGGPRAWLGWEKGAGCVPAGLAVSASARSPVRRAKSARPETVDREGENIYSVVSHRLKHSFPGLSNH